MIRHDWQHFLEGRLLAVVAALSIVLIALVVFMVVRPKTVVTVGNLQSALWNNYLTAYWHPDGQVTDPQNHSDTTSEAQGYTMLRAVWQNDPKVFSRTWQWTAAHLQRQDKLFSWLWGATPAGRPGVLVNQGGQNTASDADTDIALALILADGRWHDPAYLAAARAIIPAIWDKEVVTINGEPYLTDDDLEPASPAPLLNPSYFTPAAYRIFASIDSKHPWPQLADQSYATLQTAAQAQLGSKSSDNLPPDWVAINRQSGRLEAAPSHDTNFGFDAFRAVWQTALDWQWNHAARAKNTLGLFNALLDDWNHQHRLYAIYNHSGQPTVDYSSIALYGGTLSYFSVMHPDIAQTIYQAELASLYNPASQKLKTTLNYYDNNWAWFGVAL